MESRELERFEAAVLPHLDAAYTLARYLTRNAHDAEDVVQEACLRAIRHFDKFSGGGGADQESTARAWLLAIVRNTAYSSRRQLGGRETTEFDERTHSDAVAEEHPEAALLRSDARDTLARALDHLAPEFREVIVLRELEGLSYKEISDVAGVPVGTVMSRLSRARTRLQQVLRDEDEGEGGGT